MINLGDKYDSKGARFSNQESKPMDERKGLGHSEEDVIVFVSMIVMIQMFSRFRKNRSV